MQRLILITLLTFGSLTPFAGIALTKTQVQDRTNQAQVKQLNEKLREVMPAENQLAARDALARQQAEAALALLRLLGQGGQVWPLLRHSADPSRRTVDDQQWRLRRSGSFTYEASFQRSAHRGRPDGYAPMERRDSVGFRVGRTYR